MFYAFFWVTPHCLIQAPGNYPEEIIQHNRSLLQQQLILLLQFSSVYPNSTTPWNGPWIHFQTLIHLLYMTIFSYLLIHNFCS